MRKTIFWLCLCGFMIAAFTLNRLTVDDPPRVSNTATAADENVTVYHPDGTKTYKGASDIDRLTMLGKTAVREGWATDYHVSWGGELELTISSLLPGNARQIADAVCGGSRMAGYSWQQPRQLRVFILTSSDRPAAVCVL